MSLIEVYRGIELCCAKGDAWNPTLTRFGQFWVNHPDGLGVRYLDDNGQFRQGGHWFKTEREAKDAIDKHLADKFKNPKYKLIVFLSSGNTITSETGDKDAARKIGQVIEREAAKWFWQKRSPTFSITGKDGDVFFRLSEVSHVQIERIK